MPEHAVNQGYLPSAHFVLLLALLISIFLYVRNPSVTNANPEIANELKKEYDFIIVGAGSAGSVLANRLSESSNNDVLLLEAGGKATDKSYIPFFLESLWRTELDWNYTLEPSSNYCLGMVDNVCYYTRGKTLGGSSTVNHMTYVRGNKKDYDEWADDGNDGWSYEEILPYFKKSENNKNTMVANTKYHSTGGELTVSDQRWTAPITDLFLKAIEELGYTVGDYNGENQAVFSLAQLTIEDGSRCSTNKAFLVPANERQNLNIATHAHVTKVLIDPETKRAYGVKFFRNGAYHEVFSRKEVILSAGAANSPQILMLSGVGPRELLQSLDIPLINDLPVGFNLQDHVAFGLTFLTDDPITFKNERYFTFLTDTTYKLFKNGPFSSTLEDVNGFVNSKFQDPKEERPDLQIALLSSSPASEGGFYKISKHLSNELYETIYEPIMEKESFSITVCLLRPKSVGRLLLRSNDPFVRPLINVNYFAEEDDVKRMIDGARIVLKFMNTEAFKKVNGRYHYVPLPSCPNASPLSDEYFECLMRYETIPYLHISGTAKMGPSGDPTAVVDPELRVNGISGLRVVDGSIMPKIISGNLNAPTIMIGEKASDMIKNHWHKREKEK